MYALFVILFLMSVIAFWTGLLRPRKAIRWGSNRTRGRVFLVYGLGSLLLLIAASATAPKSTTSSPIHSNAVGVLFTTKPQNQTNPATTTSSSVTTMTASNTLTNSTLGNPNTSSSTLPVVAEINCPSNPTLGVYHPYRLEVRNTCMTVSGTVAMVRHEADKDYHINVKLDPQYANLINARNVSGEHGDLVIEVISMEDGHVPIPNVGEHITVTGPYVLDKDHGWMEIHPAWFINGQGSANYTAAEATAAVQEALNGNGDEGSYTSPSSSTSSTSSGSSTSSNTSSSKLVIVSSNLNVTPGEYASVTIRTTSGASASIEVDYESGPSKSTSLYPKTAGSDGTVTWQWKVGTRTTPGKWPVIITANDQTIQTTVNVQ